MKFTLRQLEIFVAVANAGSVSRAAEQLSLSQSAASTALGELERAYDQTLFDRVGKKLVLNDTGQWLLPRALELLARAHELEAELGTDQRIGNLRLGASLTIGNYLATLLVADFLQQHKSAQHFEARTVGASRIDSRQAEIPAARRAGQVGPGDILVRLKRNHTVRTSNLHTRCPRRGIRRVFVLEPMIIRRAVRLVND